jgi:hypothetical protein
VPADPDDELAPARARGVVAPGEDVAALRTEVARLRRQREGLLRLARVALEVLSSEQKRPFAPGRIEELVRVAMEGRDGT